MEEKKDKITDVALAAEDAELRKKEAEEAAKKKKKKFVLKHPRRFMVWMDLLGVFLLAAGLYLGIRYFMNQKFISAYESGNYDKETEQKLTNFNLNESYLPYYNLGNVAYKEEDYTRAIAFYKQALEMDPPKYKECPIRVNLALSLIKRIDFNDLSTEKKLNNAIQTLRTARTILTAHECAGPVEDNGHDPEAEQLKHDIDDMLDKLENPENNENQDQNQDNDQDQQDNSENDQDNTEENSSENDKETDQERRIREQLEEQQRQNQQQRSSEQQEYDQQNGSTGGGSDGSSQSSDSTGKVW